MTNFDIRIYSFLLVCALSIGCSRIQAQSYLWIAGDKLQRTRHAKILTQTPSPEEWRKACTAYLKAYYHDASVFKLKHIGRAVDACSRAQDWETARSFLNFQDRYREKHPGEAMQPQAWVKDQSYVLRKAAGPVTQQVSATGTKPHIQKK